MSTQVIIVVRGGLVESVCADRRVKVVVVDLDSTHEQEYLADTLNSLPEGVTIDDPQSHKFSTLNIDGSRFHWYW